MIIYLRHSHNLSKNYHLHGKGEFVSVSVQFIYSGIELNIDSQSTVCADINSAHETHALKDLLFNTIDVIHNNNSYSSIYNTVYAHDRNVFIPNGIFV